MRNDNGLTLADLIQHAESNEIDPINVYLCSSDGNPITEIDDTLSDLWFLGDEQS